MFLFRATLCRVEDCRNCEGLGFLFCWFFFVGFFFFFFFGVGVFFLWWGEARRRAGHSLEDSYDEFWHSS